MALVNLTPHAIVIVSPEGETIVSLPPSGKVARVSAVTTPCGVVDGVSINRLAYGETVDLPSEQEGTFYVCSALVRAPNPTRQDVLSPGELKRDADGRPVGCVGLVSN